MGNWFKSCPSSLKDIPGLCVCSQNCDGKEKWNKGVVVWPCPIGCCFFFLNFSLSSFFPLSLVHAPSDNKKIKKQNKKEGQGTGENTVWLLEWEILVVRDLFCIVTVSMSISQLCYYYYWGKLDKGYTGSPYYFL